MDSHIDNNLWKGRTEATLESIAKALDEIKSQTGLNCPVGKSHAERIHELEMSKSKWPELIIAIVLTAIATAAAGKLI